MKKIAVIILSALMLVLCLAGCENNSNSSSGTESKQESSSKEEPQSSSDEPVNSEESSDEIIDSSEPETESSDEDSDDVSDIETAELSEDELAEIENFLNDKENNGFVSSNYYTSPEEIELKWVFWDGADIAIGKQDWGEGEADGVLAEMGLDEFYTAPMKITYDGANALLEQKCGLSLEDFGNSIESFRYVEEYDAFYVMRSDTNYLTVNVLRGTADENGNYVIEYGFEMFMDNFTCKVTLKKTDSGYQFISNIKNN